MTKKQKNAALVGGGLVLLLGIFGLKIQKNAALADPASQNLAARIAQAPLVLNYSQQAHKKGASSSHSFMIIGYDFGASSVTDAEKAPPLELNFVHKTEGDALSVVGVQLVQGENNAAFDQVWAGISDDNVPLTEEALAAWLPETAPYTLASDEETQMAYGAGATWYKLTEAIELSAAQLEQVKAFYAEVMAGL